ncbi:MAG: endonuclease domain-containing protein [candidate division SR1 bacterium]|nr:endonuclease domain-containing protein [candidate division SR1 bacterium]
MTKHEGIFRNFVLRKKMTGYTFLRQKIIYSYILDFYCSTLKLGIEIDGESHNDTVDYDEERVKVLHDCGIKIIRYTNDEIEKKLEAVIQDVHTKIEDRKKEIKKCPPL